MKPGDKIKGKAEVTKVTKDRDGYPFTLVYTLDGQTDRMNIVKEFFAGDKEKYRALIDEARAAQDKESSAGTNNLTTYAAWDTFTDQVNAGEVTADQYRTAFQSVLDNKDALIADLGKMTKAQLLKALPGLQWRYKNEKKDRIVQAAYREIVTGFNLSGTISYGIEKDSLQNAVKDRVDNYTDADLQSTLRVATPESQSAKRRSAKPRRRLPIRRPLKISRPSCNTAKKRT